MNPIRKATILIAIALVIAGCQLIGDYQYRHYAGKVASVISNDLLEKLKAGRYEDVEDYFDYLIGKKPFSINGTRLLEEIYLNLAKKRDIKGVLDDWCASTDKHHSAFIVRGLYQIQDAWRARGGDWGYTVSEEGGRLFRERLYLAREDLKLAHQLNPKDPNSAGSMITLCMGLGSEEEEMENWFRIAVDADPLCFYPYLYKLTYLSPKWRGSQGEFSRFAEECYSSTSGGIIYVVGFHYLTESAETFRNEKAFYEDDKVKAMLDSIFDRWLSAFPKTAHASVNQAYIQYHIGDKQKAIGYCNRALGVDPNCLEALDLRAMAWYSFKNKYGFKAAEKDFKKILEIDPFCAKAAAMLGRIAMSHYGDYKKAMEYLDRAISLNDKDKGYFLSRAKAKVLLGNYQGAIHDLTTALTIDPRYELAYRARADCYRRLNEHEKAEEDDRIGRELFGKEKAKDFIASLAQGTIEEYIQSNRFIDLSTFKTIPLEWARLLSKHEGILKLDGIENLTPEIAELLCEQRGHLQLNGLRSITPEVARHLSRHEDSLHLNGLSVMTPEIAKILGQLKGHLTLSGLKSITSDAAIHLSNLKRGSLTLDGLETITPEAAKCFVSLEGMLNLRGVKSISTETAIELGKREGGVGLSGLKSLTREPARYLAKCSRSLDFGGLQELTPEVAACLSKHKGSLSFGSLKSITPQAAKHLSEHEGFLDLSGLEDVGPEVKAYLDKHKGRVLLKPQGR